MKKSLILLVIFSLVAFSCTYVTLAGAETFQIHVVSSKITNDKQVAFISMRLDKAANLVPEFTEIYPKEATSFGVVKMNLKNVSNHDIEVKKDHIVMDSSKKKVEYMGLVNFKGAMGVPNTKDLFAYFPGISPGKIRKNEVKDFEILIPTVPSLGSKDFTIQYKQEPAVDTVLK